MPHTSRSGPYRVAIEGFSDFERSALASFFRLAEQRLPAYVQVGSPDSSDFLIADADQPRVLDWIVRAQRVPSTVFIGRQAPQDALAWLTRPIEPIHIMRALDALLGGRHGDGLPRESGALPSPEAAPQAAPRTAPLQGGGNRQVLVADHSAIARSFLAQRLRALGYRVVLATDGDEALATAAQTAFAVVFADLNLGAGGGADGLQVCQEIKRRVRHPEGIAPAVVITTGLLGASDKVRGALAGCDAYLTKPLMETEFLAALTSVDPLFGRAAAD